MSRHRVRRLCVCAWCCAADALACVTATHIKTLESKCVTLIEHYKKVQAERKELLEKFNGASEAAEVAQTKLQTLSALQDLCRGLEERARKAEDERNATALDREAQRRLVDDLERELADLRAAAAAVPLVAVADVASSSADEADEWRTKCAVKLRGEVASRELRIH